MADIKNADGLFMQEYKRIFEEYMTEEFTRYSQKYQPQLAEAMKYSLFAGGKRRIPPTGRRQHFPAADFQNLAAIGKGYGYFAVISAKP